VAGPEVAHAARAYWSRYSFVRRVELVPSGVATLPGAQLAKGARVLRACIHPDLEASRAP
jgi:hypothetical protein